MFCCALLYVHSSFAIILMRKRELVALLCLSSKCLMIVMWIFLAVQFVIVVFPDYTRLLFLLRRFVFVSLLFANSTEYCLRFGY